MIVMAWENTLLASRILPPSYTPVDVASNRSQDASLLLEQDGRLTLLVILTTSAGLAIVLLFFILLRIGCLRSNGCFGRYKERHDRSPCLTAVVLDDLASTKSLVASQQTIQTAFIQTRTVDLDAANNYTIKLIDNDLIVETQVAPERAELTTMVTSSEAPETMTATAANPSREDPHQPHLQSNKAAVTPTATTPAAGTEGAAEAEGGSSDQSSTHLFKSWFSSTKTNNKGVDCEATVSSGAEVGTTTGAVCVPQQQQQTKPLETKSLCSTPSRRYGRQGSDRSELLATQKQQILARFGQHLPGFGFSQSKSSCLFEDDEDDDGYQPSSLWTAPYSGYSYRHGNQVEYMGGPFGYVDPIYSHQLAGNQRRQTGSTQRHCTIRLEELDVVQRPRPHNGSHQEREPPPPLLLLPTFARSAESLIVLSKEHRDAADVTVERDHVSGGSE